MLDGRCRFGPRAKREMVARLLAGESARAIARSLGCSPSTVTASRDRWLAATAAERCDGRWCAPRPPVPKSCPWALSATEERAILDARARTNWGPMRLTWLTGRHRSTIWKVLHRHGLSHRRRGERQTHRRFEWADAGALLHIDALRLAKFKRPGHWATGQRAEEHKTRHAGQTVVSVLDDHTRLAYCELHADETAITVTATLRRAVAWMREQGCGPVHAVMSDNHKAYTSNLFTATIEELGARQILTPPSTPRWNGKIERFFGTARREWSHSRVWPDSTARDRTLSSFIRFYNRRRPHSAAGGPSTYHPSPPRPRAGQLGRRAADRRASSLRGTSACSRRWRRPRGRGSSHVAAAGSLEALADLEDELVPGGRLVAPVSEPDQRLVVVRRTPGGLERRLFEEVRFVPLVRGGDDPG